MRSDAQMEEQSSHDGSGVSDDGEAFWVKSDAVRSELSALYSAQLSYANIIPVPASRGQQSDLSLHASEKYFFAPEEATKGETAGMKSQYEGDIEAYLHNSDVAFGDREGSMHREGTPMHFFQDHDPTVGEADDFKRSL